MGVKERLIEYLDKKNIKWLLTGEGDMLRNSGDVPTSGDENFRLVPMYNIDARGLHFVQDIVYIQPARKITGDAASVLFGIPVFHGDCFSGRLFV